MFSEFAEWIKITRQTLTHLVSIDRSLGQIQQENINIMAGLADIKTAQAAEKADLATFTSLVTQLLTAFANGTLSSADAQALVDEMNSEDASIKSSIASIQAALTPPTPTPAPPATPGQ